MITATPFSFLFMTKFPEVALEAEDSGIDWIFVDLETLGKYERQKGRNSIISDHTVGDLRRIRQMMTEARVMARVNPITPASASEIDTVVDAGAQAVMLPMFTTPEEVETFVNLVAGRAQAWLLLETAPAVVRVDEIVTIEGIARIHVGLNDLHLSLGLNFMYESLAGGMLDRVSAAVRSADTGIQFGFGGGAQLSAGHPVAPGDILREHVRLGSNAVILSRTFHGDPQSREELARRMNLKGEIQGLREAIADAASRTSSQVEQDRIRIHAKIRETARSLRLPR